MGYVRIGHNAAIVDYDFLSSSFFSFSLIHILFAAYSIRFTFGNDIIPASCLYMRNLIGADLAFFFCLLFCFFRGNTTFPSATSLRHRHDRAISMLGFTLADFVGPGGVGQIDMRIIDKLQSIDRSIAGLQALLKKRGVHSLQEGVGRGMGSGCWVLAPAPACQPEFRNSNGHRLGEDDTATGNGNWELMLATGNWQQPGCATCATSAATVTFPQWHHLYCR